MRFDDEIDGAVMEEEASAYYANILLPYSPLVGKLLEKVRDSGLSFDVIAPDHGPVWRSAPSWILSRYADWSTGCGGPRVVIAYDTMWGSTARMARAIGEGASVDGVDVRLLEMGSSHRSDVATALLGSSALFVGSSTLNNDILPTLADLLTYLRGLKPRGLMGDAFGSYGWSGESVARLRSYLQDMSVDLLGEGVRVQYVPDQDALGVCRDLGRRAAERVVVTSG
jgi:flavorubredoxin